MRLSASRGPRPRAAPRSSCVGSVSRVAVLIPPALRDMRAFALRAPPKLFDSGMHRAATSTSSSRDTLLERDLELESIALSLERAGRGQGNIVLVEAPAGIGKSALLAAACEAAAPLGHRVLRARGAELEQEFAFGVARQLFEPLLMRASAERRRSLLAGPAAVAARLLAMPGIASVGEPASPLAPDPSFAVLHGLYWLCSSLADERPVTLVVDDIHWADRASLRFLVFLLSRLQEVSSPSLRLWRRAGIRQAAIHSWCMCWPRPCEIDRLPRWTDQLERSITCPRQPSPVGLTRDFGSLGLTQPGWRRRLRYLNVRSCPSRSPC